MIRSFVRSIFHRFNIIRFIINQYSNNKNILLGSSVLIRNPQFINCGKDVAINDFAEIIAEKTSSATPSISIGNSVKIGKRSQISTSSGNIKIGDFVSIHNNTYLLGNIYIGRYSILSANIFASSGDHHPFDNPYLLIRDQDISAQKNIGQANNVPVVIEEDCWIGWGAVIKKDVYIGRGAIIGSGAVVTKDIAPYTVVVGQPAKKIRNRIEFSPPKNIQANFIEHAPYLYRGFIQLQAEKDMLGSQLNGYIGALNEAMLVMAEDNNATAMQLNGITTSENVVLYIQYGQATKKIVLPQESYTKFSIRFNFLENDLFPENIQKQPVARLSCCSIFSIHSLQSSTVDIKAKEVSPLWAIESASLIF